MGRKSNRATVDDVAVEMEQDANDTSGNGVVGRAAAEDAPDGFTEGDGSVPVQSVNGAHKAAPVYASVRTTGTNKYTGVRTLLHTAPNRYRWAKWYAMMETVIIDIYTDVTVEKCRTVSQAKLAEWRNGSVKA